MNATGRATSIMAVVLLLSACAPEEPAVRTSPTGTVPATPQRAGNPDQGYRALVNEAYISCGMPTAAWRKTLGPAPPEQRLPGRVPGNEELPYSLTRHRTPAGADLVVSNCLACHASFFNGQLVIGLGNENLDFTEDVSARAEAAGAYVEAEADVAEWKRWVAVLRATAPYTTTDTVGVNPAISATLALLAHRDSKTLAWSDTPLMAPPPPTPAATSVPPWWRMGKKHAMFYNTEGRGDQARIMMLGALLCADDVATVKAIDAYAPDIRAYLVSLKPPQWPFGVEGKLVERGRTVFERTCAACHGTYGASPTYPNLVVDLATIGTDPAMARFAAGGEGDRFSRWFNGSYYGEMAESAPAMGYIAPPLDGVWATAPYLHNGSVPTLELLLDSPRRPAYWTRSFDSKDYDPATLGWRFRALPQGKAGVDQREERKRIYDTTLPGYSNAGHTFGDALTADERRAVLEYLKTL
ncbi:c-type cytochrome [Methylotetracoccus oryzae]|uniref:c-type cytochrome n=1 Tax=Methylotetracoccus oryzae TaxID=1919059 RepID=UPI0019142701|nr:c-type cytochrome [Methylotetracoccus oryzae]